MFEGQVEEAMNFYTSLFDESTINDVFHHKNGAVMPATCTIKGQIIMHSGVEHGVTFTPAISLFVACETAEDMERLFEQLSQDGQVLMLLSSSSVSKKFGWVQDRIGVSWQLNLAKN